jgi:hypothetical protein
VLGPAFNPLLGVEDIAPPPHLHDLEHRNGGEDAKFGQLANEAHVLHLQGRRAYVEPTRVSNWGTDTVASLLLPPAG